MPTSHDGRNHTGNYTAYLNAIAAAEHRSHHYVNSSAYVPINVTTHYANHTARLNATHLHDAFPADGSALHSRNEQPLRVSNPLPVGACLAAECVMKMSGVVAAGNPLSCAAHHSPCLLRRRSALRGASQPAPSIAPAAGPPGWKAPSRYLEFQRCGKGPVNLETVGAAGDLGTVTVSCNSKVTAIPVTRFLHL